LNPRVDAPSAGWRARGNVIENLIEVGEGREGVTKSHRPCLAHVARTCSSVANSPRAAAAFDRAMAARSSAESGTGWPSISRPARASMARAISSCAAGESWRTALSASSSSLLMGRIVAKAGDIVHYAQSPRSYASGEAATEHLPRQFVTTIVTSEAGSEPAFQQPARRHHGNLIGPAIDDRPPCLSAFKLPHNEGIAFAQRLKMSMTTLFDGTM